MEIPDVMDEYREMRERIEVGDKKLTCCEEEYLKDIFFMAVRDRALAIATRASAEVIERNELANSKANIKLAWDREHKAREQMSYSIAQLHAVEQNMGELTAQRFESKPYNGGKEEVDQGSDKASGGVHSSGEAPGPDAGGPTG